MRRLSRAIHHALSSLRASIRRFAGTAAEDHEVRLPVYWDDRVALTLIDLVREAETRASGRVQVITLAEFRSAVGELWERYQNRVLLIAESTISRMIGRGNTYIPQDEDTWLLLFPALSEPEALKRADAIAAKIGEKLVGAQFTETPPPLPEAAKLDLKGALNADGSLNLDRIKAAVQSVRRATAAMPLTKAKPPPEVPKPAPVQAAPAVRSEIAHLTTGFRPAWTAETQALDSFFFRATRPDGSDIFAAAGVCPTDTTALELSGLAARAFCEFRERGLRAILTVPVPYSALCGPQLPGFQRLIANLPQRDRLVHLRIEITHVPSRVGADSLVPIRELFRPFVREVAFLLDPFQLPDQVLALDHITLGADLPRAARRSDDEIFQAMLMFRQRAGRRGTYVLGLSSRLQVAHALTAGIAEIGGPGIAGELRKLPDQVTVIRRQDLVL